MTKLLETFGTSVSFVAERKSYTASMRSEENRSHGDWHLGISCSVRALAMSPEAVTTK